MPEGVLVARRAATTVRTVVARELRTHLRNGYFVVSTVLVLAVLVGYLLLHASVFARLASTTVGLVGQATAIAEPLRQAADDTGEDLAVVPYHDAAQARVDVVRGELDVLVSGSAANLRALSGSELDDSVRALLTGVAQDEVLNAKLVEAGLDPVDVHTDVAATRVTVETAEPPTVARDERLGTALAVVLLLVLGIAGSAGVVARSLAEDGTRVPDAAAPECPRRIVLGKVVGVGLVGGIQLLVLGAAALAVTAATGALSTVAPATSALLWGLVWFVLGYALYWPVFVAAAATSGPIRSVVLPTTAVVVTGLGAAMLALPDPESTTALTASFVPPLAPFVVPSHLTTGTAGVFEVVTALLLTVAATVVLTWLARAHVRTPGKT